jgi:DNA-binding response OmpR family regulator
MRVLLVEDEPEMAAALTAALKKYDIVVDCTRTLREAKEMLVAGVHDTVLLDRQLPDGEGLTLISALRSQGATMPIIVLTAKGELTDRIFGLDHGADDYLAKPFAIEELLARIRAVLRRPGQLAPDTVRVGNLSFDFNHREAMVEGRVLDLPRRELLVLETLLKRMGRTVLRSALEQAVFSFEDDVQSNALDTHVSRLRRKLMESNSGLEIHGIRGVGYLLRQNA